MKKLRGPVPLILSLIAVVLALTGTSIALPGKNTVNSGDVKKNTLKSGDVKNDGLKGVDIDESTLSGAKVGGVATVHAATVNAGDTCAITRQTGGINATKGGPDGGDYCDVAFPTSVDNCSVGATPLHPFTDASAVGFAGIRYLGGANVRVTRRNPENNFQDAGLFSIFAVCP